MKILNNQYTILNKRSAHRDNLIVKIKPTIYCFVFSYIKCIYRKIINI